MAHWIKSLPLSTVFFTHWARKESTSWQNEQCKGKLNKKHIHIGRWKKKFFFICGLRIEIFSKKVNIIMRWVRVSFWFKLRISFWEYTQYTPLVPPHFRHTQVFLFFLSMKKKNYKWNYVVLAHLPLWGARKSASVYEAVYISILSTYSIFSQF